MKFCCRVTGNQWSVNWNLGARTDYLHHPQLKRRSNIPLLQVITLPTSKFLIQLTSTWSFLFFGFELSKREMVDICRHWDHMPIYIVGGMVAAAIMIAAHTAKQQLRHHPTVVITKQKRASISELDSPNQATDSGKKFLNKSFLRKVAHIQEPKRWASKSITHVWCCISNNSSSTC